LEKKQHDYEKRVQNSSTLQRPLTRRNCDEEFKQQALTMIRNGQTVRSVAEALGSAIIVSFRCAGTTMGANAPKAHDLLNSLADDCHTPSIIRLELKHGQYEQIDHVHRKFDQPVTQRDEVSEQRSPVTKT
jgi:transposase-like protein